MPIHDWTRVNPGIFHHFHHGWTAAIANVLNRGTLPPGYFALAEQIVGGPIPDVLTLHLTKPASPMPPERNGGMGVAVHPPKTRFIQKSAEERYARKANRIVVRHESGRVVAVLEIVSPGNKDSKNALRTFVEKAVGFLEEGVHLLIIDLFPPTTRDPQGIHKAIWDEIHEAPFELPPDKKRTLVSYSAGPEKTAYIEPVGVGDALPDMPLFLEAERYIPLGLEETYCTTWDAFPGALKGELEN